MYATSRQYGVGGVEIIHIISILFLLDYKSSTKHEPVIRRISNTYIETTDKSGSPCKSKLNINICREGLHYSVQFAIRLNK